MMRGGLGQEEWRPVEEFGEREGTAITVLHVDDDPDLVELTATFLEREDERFDVVSATSAAEGLELLTSRPVDCVVSDYQMPEMDGIEFLKAVRGEYPDLPFVLFTGKGSEEVASEAISAGVTDYLQKDTGSDQYALLANRVTNAVEKMRVEETIEQTFRAIETAREGIALVDDDGRFVYVNRAFADVYGSEREEMVGCHWRTFYPEESAERVREALDGPVAEGRSWRDEVTTVRPDGTTFVADQLVAATCHGLHVFHVRELATERTFPPGTVDALDDLLFVFDPDGSLRYWNGQVGEVTGYDDDELATLTPVELVADEHAERMARYVREAERTGEARVEADLLTAGGETVPYEFISRRITDAAGGSVGRVGVGRDVSERKRYQRHIERQNERLEHFAEVLSHDLRNPLSVALASVSLLAETGDDDHYETARAALERMDDMITDVLALARSGEGVGEGDRERVDVSAVAADAWSLVETEAASFEAESVVATEVDASRLQQVLENLFRNAMEHGPEDVSVRLGSLDEGGFYVADDGPGVPESERERIFEPGHTTKARGTGFGLASVVQIADAHGWTVSVTDSWAGGARFEVRGLSLA